MNSNPATSHVHSFPEGYGIFPYIIVKKGYAIYQQLPVGFGRLQGSLQHDGLYVQLTAEEKRDYDVLKNDNVFREKLTELAKTVFKHVEVPCCLVFDKQDAVYLSTAGVTTTQSIPRNGTLIDASGKILQMAAKHYLPVYDTIDNCNTDNVMASKDDNPTSLKTPLRFKYLNYIIQPTHIPSTDYDLVGDDEFVTEDDRIPLLVVTRFGIFPHKASFPSKYDYWKLEGLEGQTVAFLYKVYLSLAEEQNIRFFQVEGEDFEAMRAGKFTPDKQWWYGLTDIA
jgi:hypothetical protein